MGQFPLVDMKFLLQILSKQGIEVSDTFFEKPNKNEVRTFLEDCISFVFGSEVILRDWNSVQQAVNVRFEQNKQNTFQLGSQGTLSF